jgi:hypothetical protein
MPGIPSEQRFAELVRRVLGLREATTLHPIEDLMPVLPVLDPASPENALLRRERWCAGHILVTSTAGNYAQVGITNPAGSGKLITLERAVLFGSSGAQVYGRVLSLALGYGVTSTNVQNLDGRGCTDSVTPAPSAVVGSRDLAIAISPFFNFSDLPAAGAINLDLRGIVLAPAWQFLLSRAIVGAANLAVTFVWRERAVNPDELNPTGA